MKKSVCTYNCFRYYAPEIGQYTQQDPIGLTGGNPTLYGYVYNTNVQVDELGLSWSDFLRALGIIQPEGLTNPHGHHIVFKGQFRRKRGVYVGESQAILKYFNIDINDPANLMWAQILKVFIQPVMLNWYRKDLNQCKQN